MDSFDEALKFTLKWEGGYSNHPNDSGGATNHGITQWTYNEYRSNMGRSQKDVRNITDDEVKNLYLMRYWEASKAGKMCKPLSIAYFDTCVNFGISNAVMFLQESLGFKGTDVDGIFGLMTAKALKANNNSKTALRLIEGRIAFRFQRVKENKTQQVFLRGWLNRDYALKRLIKEIIKNG